MPSGSALRAEICLLIEQRLSALPVAVLLLVRS